MAQWSFKRGNFVCAVLTTKVFLFLLFQDCGKQFPSQQSLREHVKEAHKFKHKPKIVQQPPPRVKLSCQLQTQYVAAAVENPSKYKCGVCGDGFATAPQLVAHNRTHLK